VRSPGAAIARRITNTTMAEPIAPAGFERTSGLARATNQSGPARPVTEIANAVVTRMSSQVAARWAGLVSRKGGDCQKGAGKKK